MANTILTPGENINQTPTVEETTPYLVRNNYLNEYSSEQDKAIIRSHLDVYSTKAVYDIAGSERLVDEEIKKAFKQHIDTDDPHGIIPVVLDMVEGSVKNDGSTPFLSPLLGVDPISDYHLTTKRFVARLLKEHTNAEDPHRILPIVEDILEQYVKQSLVYLKNQLYTKNEIDQLSGKYIKGDGTTPFTKALIGADPLIDSHLATKRYADSVLYKHLVDIDPHGFITILNQRLSLYIKRKDVFDKTLTYSRTQIDNIIYKIVEQSILQSLNDYIDTINDKFEYIRKQNYIKLDGTIPFKSPLKGVDAVDSKDLVTLCLLNESVNKLQELIVDNQPVWRTSGPVESTVGHIDDNTEVPEVMTMLEVFDAIFYGKGITISSLEYVTINNKAIITLCVHGSTGLIEHAELYLGNELIYSFTGEDFKDGCKTVDSLPIIEDTKFIFRVLYTNEAIHEESVTVKVALPTFVGLLPKWRFGNTVTWEYLVELSLLEPNNNLFISNSNNLNLIKINYNFRDSKLRHPFVVVPESYPNLNNISISSLNFGISAFDVIDSIPLLVPGIENGIIFKMYIYRLALSSLNLEITFNFIKE